MPDGQVVQKEEYRVMINMDHIARAHSVDMSGFRYQAMMRDGVTPMRNRVFAKYDDLAEASDVYFMLRRQGLSVFRNWLDPEYIPVDLGKLNLQFDPKNLSQTGSKLPAR